MSSFADQFKNEIARLARKEVRAETKSLKKANAQYRADVVVLRRRLAALESAMARLVKGQGSSAPRVRTQASAQVGEQASEHAGDVKALRFRVAGFASLRKKLGLSAAEMGKLIGVSAQSVYHWETGKTRPRASQLAAIAAVRGMGKREVAERLAA